MIGAVWKTAYSLDFTSLSNQNIRTGGNGTKTVDGKSWTWDNDGNISTANIVNGTGLVLVASTSNQTYYPSTSSRSSANLMLPVTSAFPGFDITQHVVRVLARILLTGADAASEGGILFFEYVTTPKNQSVCVVKAFNGALGFQGNSNTDPTYENPYAFNTSTNPSDDILGLVFIPTKSAQFWSGLYVSGEKMRLRTPRGSVIQNIATAPIRLVSDVRFGICQITNNNSGTLTTTFTHLRVDYAEMFPPA